MTASSDSSTAAATRPLRHHLLLLLLLLVGASVSLAGVARMRARFVFESFHIGETSPTPVERVRLAGRDSYPAHFLLLHGYAANRRQLLHLAEVLAAAGADVYVPDLPGRGDHPGAISPPPPEGPSANMPTPRETKAALAVVRHLERDFGVSPERVVVVGHSLGGGVALEVGRRVEPVATVSLAGLERRVEPGRPPNPLFITARLEIPSLRRAADRMYKHARGASAAGRWEFFATHASLPFHSSVQRALVDWTNCALSKHRDEARLAVPPLFNERLLALELFGVLFLAALFVPLAALVGVRLAPEPCREAIPTTRLTHSSPARLFGYSVLAGVTSVSIIRLLVWLGWAHPLSFLRLAEGDYLAAVLLLATVWLLPMVSHRPALGSWRETAARAGIALGLVAYLIGVGGGFITWQLFDLWPTPTRFVKMLLLALLLFPYVLGEELLVRSVGRQKGGAHALGTFLLWRLGLLASILYGVLALGSGQTLVVVIGVPLLLLSLAEYFFSTVLYHTLGSVYADALFKTLLLGWIIATIFPLR